MLTTRFPMQVVIQAIPILRLSSSSDLFTDYPFARVIRHSHVIYGTCVYRSVLLSLRIETQRAVCLVVGLRNSRGDDIVEVRGSCYRFHRVLFAPWVRSSRSVVSTCLLRTVMSSNVHVSGKCARTTVTD